MPPESQIIPAAQSDSPLSGPVGLPLAARGERFQGNPTTLGPDFSILQYWLQIRRHAGKVAIFVAVATATASILVARMPKQYAATAVIRLDPTTPEATIGGQNSTNEATGMAAMLATDLSEITSPAVMTPVKRKLGLQKLGLVTVHQPLGTLLLQINDRENSPDRAAEVANSLADEFIRHEYNTRSAALLDLTAYMRRQTDELRARMEKSQQALNDYERANGIVDSNNSSTNLNAVITALQTSLQQDLTRQRSLEADLSLVKSGSLDDLLVSDRGQTLAALIQAVQQQEIQLDNLSSNLGPGNYIYQQAQRNLTALKASLDAEKSHVAAQISAEAGATDVRVKLTQKQLDDATAQLNNFNGRAVQYDILKHEADSDKTIYDDLLQRVNAADIDAGFHSNALRIVESGVPDPKPVYPEVGLTILFTALISLLLGMATAIVSGSFDRTLRDPETASSLVGATVLASLPAVRASAELFSLLSRPQANSLARRSHFAEAILGLRSTLELSAPGRTSYAVTSAQPREGKSTVTMNLACAFATLGRRTILIDADIRRPEIHRMLELSNRVGLATVLQGEADVADCCQPGPLPLLTVLTAGPSVPAPGELLSRGGLARLIEDLKSRFDIVLVDTPPMLGFADALSASTAVDGMILVARAGQTQRDLVRAAVQQLHHVRAPIAGIVLNAFSPEMSHRYYYYHRDYYQRYYQREGGNEGGSASRAAAGN